MPQPPTELLLAFNEELQTCVAAYEFSYQGRCIYANSHYCRFFGFEPGTLQGKRYVDILG